MPLCKPCHQQVHCTKIGSYRLIIHGYVYSITGPRLNYERILNNHDNNHDNDNDKI